MCRIFRTLFLSALLLLTIAALPAAAENRVALVVGNAHYKFIPSLANPAGDARLMAKTLKDLGFTLIGDGAQLDLDKAALDEAIRTFGTKLRGADVGLFYYAGHGLQLRGTNYLVPTGANPTREADADFELDDLSLVLRQMEASGTRLNLVMLDACRNNPFAGRGFRAIDAGLAQIRAPEGTLISFATQPGSIALDGVDGNSPYTKALAQTIRKPGLGVFDVFNNVGLTVKKATAGEQQPWVSSSPIDGSFYFAAKQRIRQSRQISPRDRINRRSRTVRRSRLPRLPRTSLRPLRISQIRIGQVRITQVRSRRCRRFSRCRRRKNPPMNARKGVVSPSTMADGPTTRQGAARSPSGVRSRSRTASSRAAPTEVDGSLRTDMCPAASSRAEILPGQFWGRMSSSSFGSGSWRNSIGCSGAWTFTKS